jgi:L-threonylcarbamoyladenylate synthase
MTCAKDDLDSVSKTVSHLVSGEVVIVPTDTVYGFSAVVDLKGKSCFNADRKIREIKGRDEGKPFIHLISSPQDIEAFSAVKIPPVLFEKWPGPLTVIVPVKKDSPLCSTLETVAFRCPGDKWLRDVIRETGAPIFSTSVNRSGFPVIDTVAGIESEFSGEVPLIVDDGDKKGSVPSTIVSVLDGGIKVLRQGAVVIDS